LQLDGIRHKRMSAIFKSVHVCIEIGKTLQEVLLSKFLKCLLENIVNLENVPIPSSPPKTPGTVLDHINLTIALLSRSLTFDYKLILIIILQIIIQLMYQMA